MSSTRFGVKSLAKLPKALGLPLECPDGQAIVNGAHEVPVSIVELINSACTFSRFLILEVAGVLGKTPSGRLQGLPSL